MRTGILDKIFDARQRFIMQNGREPKFLVVGGDYATALDVDFAHMTGLRGKPSYYWEMQVVRVVSPILEVAE